MSPVTYAGLYQDAHGREQIDIIDEGRTLRTRIRGIDFRGVFDSLEHSPEQAEQAARLFTLQRDTLCACRIEWTMRIPLLRGGERYLAPLHAAMDLGEPTANGGLTYGWLRLRLDAPSGSYETDGRSGWFEDELRALVTQLPPGETITTCFTCAFSDYHPVGHGIWGDLACFRDAKHAYAQIRGKSDLLDRWKLHTEFVAETHHCDQHAARVPGSGYRG